MREYKTRSFLARKNYMPLLVGILLLHGCALFEPKTMASKNSILLAHGGVLNGDVKNTRSGLHKLLEIYAQQSTKKQIDGIEVDIVLTRDKVPVLAHDPWLDKACYHHVEFAKNKDRVYFQEVTFDELTKHYLCHSTDGKLEALVSLDELLTIIKPFPDLVVYLDLKIQKNLTLTAYDYALAVMSRWESSGLENPLYLEGPTTQALKMYQDTANDEFNSILSYPPFYAYDNWTQAAIKTALRTVWNKKDPLNEILKSNAQGIVSPVEIMLPWVQEAIQKQNKHVVLFAQDNVKSIKKACKSGADLLIIDYLPSRACW